MTCPSQTDLEAQARHQSHRHGDALWHFTIVQTWDPADPVATSPEALSRTFSAISTQMDPLRAITPNGGAYQNEADVYETDPISSF
ncbi:hypothetical protein V8C26DRAFT_427513 [Trichoderma gracile]